jgi:hypothetical protein
MEKGLQIIENKHYREDYHEYKIINAFGLKTRVHCYDSKYGYGCAECCNGDRCDEDCYKTTPYHGRRKVCPHCKGKGWINIKDIRSKNIE